MAYPKNRAALVARLEKLQAEIKALQEGATQLGLNDITNLSDNGLGRELEALSGRAYTAHWEAKWGK